jgi:hypothetical protein
LRLPLPPHSGGGLSFNLGQGAGGGLNERIIQLIALLTVLSLAPSIPWITSFTRIVLTQNYGQSRSIDVATATWGAIAST